MNGNEVKNTNKEFARMCSDYSKEHNLPFQMVLALKMSERRINKCIEDLNRLNSELLRMGDLRIMHYFHNLHEVGDFRVKLTLDELDLPRSYSRFINEKFVKQIIWKNTKYENEV